MVYLDDRAGSGALWQPLRSQGLDVQLTRMDYADVAFQGNGPEGCPVQIGIEHKQVGDIVKCMHDGRFAGHQLPGLVANYGVVYLLVEGSYRANPKTGELEVPAFRGTKKGWANLRTGQRGVMYRELESFLITLETKAGIKVRRTFNTHESCLFIKTLYNWWTVKAFEQHRSHLAFDESGLVDQALLVRPSLLKRVAKELPGIGWKKSAAVAAHFTSVAEMVGARSKEWQEIEGIGKTMADRIVRAVGGGASQDGDDA